MTTTSTDIPPLRRTHPVRNFTSFIVAIGLAAGLVWWLGPFALRTKDQVDMSQWDATAHTITATVTVTNHARLAVDVTGVGATGNAAITVTGDPARTHLAHGASADIELTWLVAGCTGLDQGWRVPIRIRTAAGVTRTLEVGVRGPGVGNGPPSWQTAPATGLCPQD